MTKSLGVVAFTGLVLTLAAAALLYLPSGASAGDGLADFEMIMVSESYEDLDGNPITEIPEGQDFRVRVDFMFRNNGPDAASGAITVKLTAPEGCEFVQPADGVDTFFTSGNVQKGEKVTGWSTLKVRCTSAGSKQFSAMVSADPAGLFEDQDEDNNALSVTGPGITVTAVPCPQSALSLGGGSPCPAPATPTPTPSPTPTPTPTPTLPPGETPGLTSTPAPTPIPLDDLIWGDLDCDEDVDAVDGLKTLQLVGGIKFSQKAGCPKLGGSLPPTPAPTSTPIGQTPSPAASPTPIPADDLIWGDLDCDGDVDAVDALKGLRQVVGLPFLQEPGCPEIGGGLTPSPTPSATPTPTPSATPTPTPVE